MKIAISIHDLLARHDHSAITAQLDSVYGVPESNSCLDAGSVAMQFRTLKRHAGL